MQRYTFATFLVDEANREAYKLCRDLAGLRWDGAPAIALVGERGFGKTHLLYSIVNHVRASTTETGIAYVRGGDFPREVRDLVANPGPVRSAKSAILIVDDIDAFGEAVDVLERLVRLFLEHGHRVLFASSTPVAELTYLPASLRETLQSAHIVTIVPDAKSVPGDSIIDKMEDRAAVIARQEERIAELEAALRTGNTTRDADSDEPPATDTAGEHQSFVSELRERLDDAQDEIEHLRGENALLNVSTREHDTLRTRIRELEELQYAAGDDSAWLEESASTTPEPNTARAKANEMLARADELMEAVASESALERNEKANEGALAQERDETLAELEEVRAELDAANRRDAEIRQTIALATQEIDRLKEAVVSAQVERDELRDAFPGPEADDAQFAAEVEAARAECDRLRGAIVRARAERETVKAQLRRTVEELNRYTSDQEYREREEAQHEEAAERRIRNLQEQVANLKSELEETLRTNGVITAELQTLHAQLGEPVEPQGTNIADFEPRGVDGTTPEDATADSPAEDSTLPEAPPSDPDENDNPSEPILLGEPDTRPAPDPLVKDTASVRHGFQTQPHYGLHEMELPRAAAVGEGDRPFVTGARPDFGDSVQSDAAPTSTSSLHHVEELRDELDAAIPPPDADSAPGESSSDPE